MHTLTAQRRLIMLQLRLLSTAFNNRADCFCTGVWLRRGLCFVATNHSNLFEIVRIWAFPHVNGLLLKTWCFYSNLVHYCHLVVVSSMFKCWSLLTLRIITAYSSDRHSKLFIGDPFLKHFFPQSWISLCYKEVRKVIRIPKRFDFYILRH